MTADIELRHKGQMRTLRKSAAFHFALIAMLLRAVLPAGWMPNPRDANASPFVICTMDGPVHPAPAPDRERASVPCVFAAAAPLTSPSVASTLPAPALFATAIVFHAPRDAAAPTVAYRPNAARAPPAFA